MDAVPISVAVIDVNEDHNVDLIVVYPISNSIGIYLNDGSYTFTKGKSYPTGDGPQSILLADVNDDQKLDLIVSNLGSLTVGIYLDKTNGEFDEQQLYPTQDRPYDVILTDIDNDQQSDILIRYQRNLAIIYGDCLKNYLTKEE